MTSLAVTGTAKSEHAAVMERQGGCCRLPIHAHGMMHDKYNVQHKWHGMQPIALVLLRRSANNDITYEPSDACATDCKLRQARPRRNNG